METRHDQGTSTRELAGGAVEEPLDDGRDRDTPVGTDDIGGIDARPERPATTRTDDEDDDIALLPPDEGAGFQYRWQELQTGFVDEPRRTVEHYRAAHAISMASAAQHADTEDLRNAMVHYRALFDDLLEDTKHLEETI